MGTWHDLPTEIHDHILQLFCIDIIEAYVYMKPPKDASLFYYNGHPSRTDTPKSLKNLSSALQTCRSIHNSIVHNVKMEGVQPIKMLQLLQRYTLELLISGGGLWSFQLVTTYVGVFWKNPSISHDVEFMVKVMSSL